MADIRYIRSFTIGQDYYDLTFLLISTHIFEVRDANIFAKISGTNLNM